MSRKTGEVVIPGGRQLSFPYKKAEDCILNKFADDIKLEGVADNTRWLCHFSEVLPQQKWAEECPEVQKGKYKVTKNSPGHQPILGIYQLESSFSKNDLGILVNKKVTTSQQCTLVAKKATRRKRVASRSREVILCLWCWWGCFWNAASPSGLPGTTKIWMYCSKSSTWPQRWLRDWSTYSMRRG